MSKNKLIWTEEELPQGSAEWLLWRSGIVGVGEEGGTESFTLGGSEIAPLMYMSPWATPLEVFKWKLGLEERTFSESTIAAMDRGNRLEPIARKHYENTYGVAVRQLCAIHPDHPWMRTSLDGITEDNKVILEIKSPRDLKNHKKQTKGDVVPTYRYPQLQWQLAVMREHYEQVERVDYVSFYLDDESGYVDMKVIPIYPNEDFIAEVMRRGELFVTEHLQTGIPPKPNIFLEDLPLKLSYPQPKFEGYWQPNLRPQL